MKQKILKNVKSFAVSKAPQAAKCVSQLAVSSAMTSVAMASKAGELMGKIIGTIGQIATYVGAGLFAQGMFQLVMAFKDDNADSKSKAIMFILSSLILMSLNTVISEVISAAGISGLGATTGGLL